MSTIKRDYAKQAFLTVAEREQAADEEAKYEAEKAIRALRSRIGFSEANRFVTEEILKSSYRELVW